MNGETISDFKKLQFLIRNVFHRKMSIIYQNEYDKARKEYVNIVKEYVIPKNTNATVDEVWNVYTKINYLTLV